MLKEIEYCEYNHTWLPSKDDPLVCKECHYLHPDYSITKLVEYMVVLEEVAVMLGQEMMRLYSDTKNVVEGYQALREEFDSTRSHVETLKGDVFGIQIRLDEVVTSTFKTQEIPPKSEGETPSE